MATSACWDSSLLRLVSVYGSERNAEGAAAVTRDRGLPVRGVDLFSCLSGRLSLAVADARWE